MVIKQALVAAGGTSGRFHDKGMPKALVLVRNRPLIYWTILSLIRAGITKIIVASNKPELMPLYKTALRPLKAKISFFVDPGRGSRGLMMALAHAKHLLDSSFLFTVSHIPLEEKTLKEMMKKHDGKNVVVAAYRQPKKTPTPMSTIDKKLFGVNQEALHLPLVCNKNIADALFECDFDSGKAIMKEARKHGGIAIIAKMPDEFDYYFEYKKVKPYLKRKTRQLVERKRKKKPK